MLQRFLNLSAYIFSLPKTLIFNFHYFPFSTAIKLPVYVSPYVKFEKLGGKVVLHDTRRGCIRMGYQSGRIKTTWYNEGVIEFMGKADIRGGSQIWSRGHLTIGAEFTINQKSSLVAGNRITIGKKVLLSSEIMIIDSDFHSIYDSNGAHINASEPIEIGDKVWIGYRCMLLKGAKIPGGSVIGAGSIVTKQFTEENVILAGVPAKIVKQDIVWVR